MQEETMEPRKPVSGTTTRRRFFNRLGASLAVAGSTAVLGKAEARPSRHPEADATQGLRGPMVFVTTPMLARDGEALADYDGMGRNIGFLASRKGPYCLCICGGTGEFRDLTAEEIESLTRAAAETKGDASLIVGVGGADTEESVRRAQDLQRAGADALLAMPVRFIPAEVKYQEEMYRHLAALCSGVEIGVIPYRASYFPLEMETILRLSEIPNFVALKSADKHPEWYHELSVKAGGRLPMFPGSDFGAPYWHLAGCAGFTTGLANLVPQFCIELWEMLDEGRYVEAVKKTTRLRPLGEFRRKHGNAMIKAGMELLGYAGGPMRRTMKVLEETERDELRRLLEEMGAKV